MSDIIKTIRAKIEQLKKHSHIMGDNAINSSMRRFYEGAEDSCNSILALLDTIQEQPTSEEFDRDLDKEAVAFCFDRGITIRLGQAKEFARHFYELGCCRTAEMYDDIEYNRQMAEEKQPVEGLEEELKNEIDEKWDEFVSSEGEREDFTRIARHFVDWGAEHLK